jgi:hypothetical protein
MKKALLILISVVTFSVTYGQCNVTLQSGSSNICAGSSITLGVSHNFTSPVTYNWGNNSILPEITVTPQLSQSFSCTISDGTTTCTTTDFPITVIPVPEIQNITPGARCDAGIVNLSATASAGIVNWFTTPTGGTSLSTGNTYTPTVSSTTTFYADATNNGCTCPRTAVTATINPTPSITSQSQTICSSNSFSLIPANGTGNIVPPGTTYSWSAPSVPGITGTAAGSSASSIAGSLTNITNTAINVDYTVIPNSGNCTGSSFTATITVNPKPNVVTQTATICSAGSFNIAPSNGTGNIVTTGTTFSWSAPSVPGISGTVSGNTASNISGTLTNGTNAAINVDYTITPTSGSCTGSSFTTTITVNPKPSVITQAATICSAGSFNIAPSNGTGNIVPTATTYSWSAPIVTGITGTAAGSSASSITGSLTNSTNIAINVGYTVTPTSGSCTGSSFSATITVNPKPNVVAQTATICSAGSFNITPTNGTGGIIPNGTTYSWNSPSVPGISGTVAGNSASNIGGTLTNETNALLNVAYTVTPTSGSCTGSSFTTTITVNPKPSVITQAATICSAGSFNIAPSNGTGNIVPTATTYSWSAPIVTGITGTAAGSSASSITGSLTNSTNIAINVGYTVTPTSGSCIGSSFAATITVNPKPNVSTQTATICSVGSFNMTPTNGTGGIIPIGTTYSWSAPSVPGITGTSAGSSASSISGTLSNLTNATIGVNYTVTPNSGSCTGNSFNTTINVKPVPAITSNTQEVCSNSDFQGNWVLPNIVPFNTNYTWSVTNNTQVVGETNSTIAQLFGQTLTNLTLQNQTVVYNVTPVADGCVGNAFTLNLVVKPSPIVNAGQDFTKTCLTNTSGNSIGSAPIPGYTYSWSPSSNLSSSTAANPNANPNSTTPYTLTVTDILSGCSASDQVIVSVDNNNPIANAGNDGTITCNQNSSGYTIGITPTANISYSWIPVNGLASSNSSSTVANPNATTTYTLNAINLSNGCSANDQVTVFIDKTPPVANAGSDFTKTCISNVIGNSIGMNAQPNVNYSWSPTTGLTASNIANPFANPTSTTTFELTTTSSINGCTANDHVVVTVNQNYPAANAGSDFTKTCTSYQNGNAIGMVNVQGISYSWTPTQGLTNSTNSNTTANPSQTTLYTLTSTDLTNGCTSSDQVLVTVNNAAPTAYAGLDATITCNQNTNGAVIGIPPVSGITYSWTPNNGLTTSNQSEVIANPNGNTTYTLTATNTTNGCVSSDAVSVNIDITPPLVNAGNDQVICQGEQISLNGTSNGAQVNWTPSFLVQNPNQMSTEGNISGTTTFTLTATGNNGCIAQDFITAQISSIPVSGLNTSYEICQNETLDLIVNSGVTCSWSGIYTGVGNSVSLGGLESGLLNLNLTNNDGCAASETISVVVNPIPYPIISGAQAVCQNSYWEKYSVPSTSNELAWSVTNGELMSFSNANDAIVHWGLGTSGIINITETISQTGCSNNYSYEVLLDNSIALDTAEVLQLSSNVLYTPQDYTFMNWGYQSIQTNIPVSVGVYSQYCNFLNFDPSQNYYWVEIGDGNGCVTKSYFNNPIFTADLEHITSQHINVFPNPTSGFVTIETDFSEFNFEIITIEGQVLKSGKGSYSIDFTDLNYPSGVYYLNISSNGSLFKHKIIKL